MVPSHRTPAASQSVSQSARQHEQMVSSDDKESTAIVEDHRIKAHSGYSHESACEDLHSHDAVH